VNQWLAAAGFPTTKQVPPAQFTVNDAEASFESLKTPVDKAVGKLDQEVKAYERYPLPPLPFEPTEDDRRRERDELKKRSQRRKTHEEGIALSRRLATRLTQEKARCRSSAVRLLMLFYDSPECSTAVTKYGGPVDYAQLLTRVREQRQASRLSPADRYLLLWIMRILGEYDSTAVAEKASPLKEYSHVVVDEAQYYRPLLLRLLHAVTKEPRKSMTIVGDLEQRISSDGGLITWEAAGIVVPKENVRRLDTNYRWSKQVFGFLSQFRKATGLRDSLRQPHVWYSKEGVRPDVVNCRTREQECEALAQRINQIKTSEESKRWSIAVVLPFDEKHDAVRGLIELFRRCDVRARWASGQDLRESKDHVVLTTYDSVVGIEFDAVMLPGVDLILRRTRKDDALRALWVAVTRARKYEWLSGLEGDTHWAGLFGKGDFDPYRRAADEFLS
jgi:DNA helicase IV